MGIEKFFDPISRVWCHNVTITEHLCFIVHRAIHMECQQSSAAFCARPVAGKAARWGIPQINTIYLPHKIVFVIMTAKYRHDLPVVTQQLKLPYIFLRAADPFLQGNISALFVFRQWNMLKYHGRDLILEKFFF